MPFAGRRHRRTPPPCAAGASDSFARLFPNLALEDKTNFVQTPTGSRFISRSLEETLREGGTKMPKAFIMVDVHPGKEKEVHDGVQGMAKVKFVYEVTGEHDMIAFVDAEPYEEFAVLLSNIRKLPGVKDTDTQLVLK